jgi:hypothetical protein
MTLSVAFDSRIKLVEECSKKSSGSAEVWVVASRSIVPSNIWSVVRVSRKVVDGEHVRFYPTENHPKCYHRRIDPKNLSRQSSRTKVAKLWSLNPSDLRWVYL